LLADEGGGTLQLPDLLLQLLDLNLKHCQAPGASSTGCSKANGA